MVVGFGGLCSVKWIGGTGGFLLVYAVIMIIVSQLEIHCGLSPRLTVCFHNIVSTFISPESPLI